MSNKYRIETTWGDEIIMGVDLSDPDSTISYLYEGEVTHTQYKTIDAEHDMRRAAELLLSTFGSDWLGNEEPSNVIDVVELITG